MTKVVLGRYAVPYYLGGPTFFASDVFWEPDYGVLGMATSSHHYHLAPVAERDVQAAFDIVRLRLIDVPGKTVGVEALENLLRAIHCGFAEIDMHAHLAGLELVIPSDIPTLPKPVDDPESEPWVSIVLLQFHKQHLFIASPGGFLVYLVRSTGMDMVFGLDVFSNTRAGGVDNPTGRHISGRWDIPKIFCEQVEIKPGNLIVVTTFTLAKMIALTELDYPYSTKSHTPEMIDRRLRAALQSVLPEGTINVEDPQAFTKQCVLRWGAAWAIASVE